MKITDNRKKPVDFNKIKVGEFFEYDDYFWIKYDMDYVDNNCLNLNDCVKDSILPGTMVMPVDAELIIHK